MKVQAIIIIILVSMMIVRSLGTNELRLDLNLAEVTLNEDSSSLVVSFRSTGGTGLYRYSFGSLPYGWWVTGNAITVSGFSPYHSSKWSVQVEVSDSSGAYVQQTILLSFIGYYVGFTPMTLPVKGIRELSSPTIASGRSSISEIPSSIIASASISQISDTQLPWLPEILALPSLNDLVAEYPGVLTNIETGSSLVSEFINNYGSDSLTIPKRIAAAQPSQIQTSISSRSAEFSQHQAVFRRQTAAKNLVTNLLILVQKLGADQNSTASELVRAQTGLAQISAAVQKCDSDIVSAQDIQAKFKNALKDKESRLGQFKTQIKTTQSLLIEEESTLEQLKNEKNQMQLISLPFSQALPRLQKSLKECEKSLKDLEISRAEAELEMQSTVKKIQLLKTQTVQALKMDNKLDRSLLEVKTKIADLQKQLQKAKDEEILINEMKSQCHILSLENDQKIRVLEVRRRNITTLLNKETSKVNCSSFQTPQQAVQLILSSSSRISYSQLVQDIAGTQSIINKLKSSLTELQQSSSALTLEASVLTPQLSRQNSYISRITYLCKQSKMQSVQSKAVVQELNFKLATASRTMLELSNQLDHAKVEEQLASESTANYNYASSNNDPSSTSSSSSSFHATQELVALDSQKKSNQVQPPSRSDNKNNVSSLARSEQQKIDVNDSLPILKVKQETDSVLASSNETSGLPVMQDQLPNNFIIGESAATTTHVNVGDPISYLRKVYNMDISDSAPIVGSSLYVVPEAIRDDMVVREASLTLGLSSFTCDQPLPSSTNSGVVTDLSIGTITAKGQDGTIYQLTLSLCTKLASTSETSSLGVGSLIYFQGDKLFALSNSVLYNAYLIVRVGQSP